MMLVGSYFLADNQQLVAAVLLALAALMFLLLAFINYVILLGRLRHALAA